tara:strand:+ start:337 stop:528 length:192 start_codon:yes stop_codon:yes gene_type:complete
MKIIYEKGDVVEIQDNIDAPYELAAMTVELKNKVSSSVWEVETLTTWVGKGGKIVKIHEDWFV